ncbi:Outer membrane protein (porin) [Roseovarius marisflavi]|uniref:Outer membrane protein (Porin) n=1 Tax=Roseovarius marisflavi TaxID=1054996 RepID=A0A1M6WT05_9RHOB|nr:porin [Roseovarius marisflavi]SHK96877.1 Outer membrane protein (porin) [Roseovarius marisflavi]
MKKQLLCTSAIALGCAIAAPASAQEWDMDWGGFFNTHVAYTDVGGSGVLPTQDFDGVNVFVNREIHFTPSVTLDNGLTFGVNVQMEADNSSAPSSDIDETYMTISSDTMGKIILGNENSAGYLSMGSVYTPGVGSLGINSGSISGFMPLTGSAYTFRSAAGSSLTEVGSNNDVPRITYFTPSFNGLTVGVSYAPNGDFATGNARNNGAVDHDAAGGLRDIFDIGASYKQSFNGVDLALAGRYGTGERQAQPAVAAVPAVPGNAGTAAIAAAPGGDPETWGIGATVGMSGFTVGATYAENDSDVAGGAGDQEGWSLGATYDIPGPWTVGLDTYQGEFKNGAGVSKDEYEAYKLGASRSLGAGVSWDVYAIYAETTNGSVGGLTDTKIDATIIGTAINLSF